MTSRRPWFRAALAVVVAVPVLVAVFVGTTLWSGCRPMPECTGVGPAVCQLLRDQRAQDEAFARVGWSRACHNELAVDYSRGPSDRAWLDHSIRACARSDARACTIVAKAYAYGCRVERDPVYARALFRWACAADDLDACYAFGRATRDARDETYFNAHIQRILNARCARGDAKACVDLADLTWNGYRGTPQSQTHAMELLKAPCEGGDVQACNQLEF